MSNILDLMGNSDQPYDCVRRRFNQDNFSAVSNTLNLVNLKPPRHGRFSIISLLNFGVLFPHIKLAKKIPIYIYSLLTADILQKVIDTIIQKYLNDKVLQKRYKPELGRPVKTGTHHLKEMERYVYILMSVRGHIMGCYQSRLA